MPITGELTEENMSNPEALARFEAATRRQLPNGAANPQEPVLALGRALLVALPPDVAAALAAALEAEAERL